MASRLPIPDSDDGAWGTILNDYLSQSHNADGTLKPAAVGAAGAVSTSDARLSDERIPTDASVTDSKIASTLSPAMITGTALTQATGDARYVRSVNGTGPDGTGNVVVSGGTASSAWRRRDIPDAALVNTLATAPALTLTQQATSTIASAVLVAPSTGNFLYRGAADFGFGAAFPDTLMYLPASRYPHSYGAQSLWSVEFMTDASVFELYFKYSGSGSNNYRLKVDGRRVTDVTQATGATSAGSRHVLKFDFTTSAVRRICFEFHSFPFGGIYIPPTASLWKPAPLNVRWAVLGDSITGGSSSNAGNGIGSWMYRAADYLGWDDPFNESLGGTGYINASTTAKFGDRVAADIVAYNPSQVVVWGGYNDAGQSQVTIASEAAAVYAALKSGLPNASIYVIGCWSPSSTVGPSLSAVDATLLATATAAGLPFTSTITGNVYNGAGTVVASQGPFITGTGRVGATTGSGNADAFIGTDAVHPTDAGHTYLARRLSGAIAALLAA